MKKLLYIVLLGIVLSSCEDIVDVELRAENTDVYVVDAIVATDMTSYVYLSSLVPVTEEYNPIGISDAIVYITDNTGIRISFEESGDNAGYYFIPSSANAVPEVGRSYTLTIITNNDTLRATDYLSPVEPIDSIVLTPSERGDGLFMGLFTYGWETKGLGNYYKWDIYVNDTMLTDPELLGNTFVDDSWVDGNYVNAFEIFTDFYDPNDTTERVLNAHDVVYVNQKSMSKFAFDYFYEAFSQTMNGSPIGSVPPANIASNFTSTSGKDVLGVFMAHDVSRSNTILITQKLINQLRRP